MTAAKDNRGLKNEHAPRDSQTIIKATGIEGLSWSERYSTFNKRPELFKKLKVTLRIEEHTKIQTI